jgi:hypothetical protein
VCALRRKAELDQDGGELRGDFVEGDAVHAMD